MILLLGEGVYITLIIVVAHSIIRLLFYMALDGVRLGKKGLRGLENQSFNICQKSKLIQHTKSQCRRVKVYQNHLHY